MAISERTEAEPATASSPTAPSPARAPSPGRGGNDTGASGAPDEGYPSSQDTPRSSAATRSPELTDQQSFQISCLRNARYHDDREHFFSRLQKLAMFVVVLGGTASFATVLDGIERKYAMYPAIVVTIAGLLDLVFDISGKARLHASLRQRFYDLLARAEDANVDLIKLRQEMISTYADEPPCMHAANAIAYNGAMTAFGRPKQYHLHVALWQRLLRDIWPFSEEDFKTIEERAAR